VGSQLRSDLDWTVFGGAGYWLDSGADALNAGAGGVTVLYQFSDRLQLGGEPYGSTPHRAVDPATLGFNLGGVWQFNAQLGLLFSAGRGLRNVAETNQLSAYLGLRTSWR